MLQPNVIANFYHLGQKNVSHLTLSLWQCEKFLLNRRRHVSRENGAKTSKSKTSIGPTILIIIKVAVDPAKEVSLGVRPGK
jgi:hypothetical protein